MSRSLWFINVRQLYIDWHLTNYGTVCGSDLAAAFGITRTQGARDIDDFRKSKRRHIIYDTARQAFVPVGQYRSENSLRPGEALTLVIAEPPDTIS